MSFILTEIVKEMDERVDALVPGRQVQVFVRRMDVVTGQSHTYQY